MTEKIFLYNHGGSANHGCEALVRTIGTELAAAVSNPVVMSESLHEDYKYGLQHLFEIESAIANYSRCSLDFFKAYWKLKRHNDYFAMDLLPYLKSLASLDKRDIGISIGGDIYCYEDYPKFIQMHQLVSKRVYKTALIGCSLNDELFDDANFRKDINSYSLITARESLTYNLLQKHQVHNIKFIPDSAFLLPTVMKPLPKGFIDGNTIGINLSPLVERKEVTKGIVLNNFRTLISHILANTDMTIALIPHVVWKDNDDRIVLKKLYDEFRGSGRILMISDCNCMELKGYISRCRMFIGARTHATIAAYSSCVPTLAIGYSIKARGIAKDIFGTEEGYVVSIDNIRAGDDILNSFMYMIKNEDIIKNKLVDSMPSYIDSAKEIRQTLSQFVNGQ